MKRRGFLKGLFAVPAVAVLGKVAALLPADNGVALYAMKVNHYLTDSSDWFLPPNADLTEAALEDVLIEISKHKRPRVSLLPNRLLRHA